MIRISSGTASTVSPRRVLTMAGYMLIFAISHTQALLYTSNQNTKFLHGMADAGVGFLAGDWLARTVDPLPFFSLLIHIVYGCLHEYIIYLFYFILLGVYIYGMLGIADRLFRVSDSLSKEFTFFSLFTLMHAAIAGTLQPLLTEGVADQYLLKNYLQPCVFGVLMILSLRLYLEKKKVFGVILLCAATWFHTAYLFPAALFVCAFMLADYLETGDVRRPAVIGALALACVLPVVLYTKIVLAPEGVAAHAQALDIIVNWRIPHHAIIARWLDWTVIVKIILMCAALWLVRSNRQLFIILLFPFAGGALFTLVQASTGSLSLALLAPWRVSAFLVPLASMIILARFVVLLPWEKTAARRLLAAASGLLVILMLYQGASDQVRMYRSSLSGQFFSMMEHIKRTKQPGETYLIPNHDVRFDMFRMRTGAPVFITWKSHPYRDGEVLEWYRRNLLADRFYQGHDRSSGLMKEFMMRGVTHLVVPRIITSPDAPGLALIYENEKNRIYRIGKPQPNGQ